MPDLQREAGVALGDTSAWPEPVRAGIASHHRADAAFHDLAVFVAQSRALTEALLAAEVPRGAARAVGHAGWELLFDGALLERSGMVDAYLAALRVDVRGYADEWSAVLDRRVTRGAPSLYADPDGVTELLWRVLGRRRLLAFDRSHRDAISGCLRAAQPTIVASVDDVIGALT